MKEEKKRIEEKDNGSRDWLKWGPYLAARQWGTVREDYSADGDAWNYFPHEHARSRAYRWGEDGIAGVSDRYCNMCFGIALWNGNDPIIKERLFGLSGPRGNHGEDVKELYYYLENTPTHSYMKHLYKYPQKAFPYDELVEKNKLRSKSELEYELLDTGVFKNNAYFDVTTEYAKADEEDLLIKITILNRGDQEAPIWLLPTIWIRNLWSFVGMPEKPVIKNKNSKKVSSVQIDHHYVGSYNFYFEKADHHFFTDNETNREVVFDDVNDHPFKKDLFHKALIGNKPEMATQKDSGTKFAPVYQRKLAKAEECCIRLRLSNRTVKDPFGASFESLLAHRTKECEDFYKDIGSGDNPERKAIQKHALAGLLWSKQYYNYDVETWLKGDSKESPPPAQRWQGRNVNWKTLRNHDILLMPDNWEYPWYAAWDSAFHCTTMALVDPHFAKEQLLLFTKEWYMAPNGQIPAYEWSFSDVNPPVQAWATLNVFNLERRQKGKGDTKFLRRMFNKLALNFTWWVNRLDSRQNNVFEGGFLGLDNIGVFDRSTGIPGNGILEQVDGTAWMALYCLNMLEISLELALEDASYVDMAVKYFGHFVFIAEALNKISIEYEGTWDVEEGFFYDKLILPDGRFAPIKVRSIAGMLSMVAVLCVKKETLQQLPEFAKSVLWFKKHRMRTLKYPVIQEFADGEDLLLSLVPRDRMEVLMKVLLDEKEFLSPYGIRSLSKIHEKPYTLSIDGMRFSINYEPAESSSGMFGGNSNWRGPVWFPMNYLFIQALEEYHRYCGDELTFEFPTGSKKKMNLMQIRKELSKCLVRIFEKDADGNRAVNALHKEVYKQEEFKDLILFYEYFHGDTGRGVGASHQTGWTSLVANMIDEIK